MPVPFLGLGLLFLAGHICRVFADVVPPVAASFSNESPSQIQANWTDNTNPPGTTYYAIISSGSSPSTNGFIGNRSSTTLNLNAIFPPLSPNTTYFVDVAALDVDGSTSAYTPLGSDITLAMPPASSAVSAITATGFTYTWNVNHNPSGTRFEVSYSTDNFVTSVITPIQITDNFTNNTTTFNTLASGTLYNVRVRAANAGGQFTAFDTVFTQTLPAIPSGLSGSALGTSSITWTWNAVTGATGYKLYQATSSVVIVTIPGGLSTTYTEMNLSPNISYGRRISALDNSGEGALSSSTSAFTMAAVPGIPGISNVFTSSFTATWAANGNPNTTRFEVSRSTDSSFATVVSTPIQFTDNFTAHTTTLTGLTSGTTYFVRVRAINDDSSSTTTFKGVASAKTKDVAGIPQNLVGTAVSASSINWSWSAVTGATAYNVYEATSTTTLLATVPGPNWQETGLTPNTIYARVVTTLVNTTESDFSASASTVTDASAPLVAGAPVVLSTQITASWAANNNPPNTQYTAEISQDSGFTTFTPLTTSNLFVTFPSLTPNTTYFMRVMAVNLAGVATTPTNLLTARTLPGAPTPAPFSNVSTTQIQANWIAPANGSDNSYLAIISSAPNPSTNNLAGNKSSSTLNTFALFTSGLSPNTSYFVDVQSINNSGNSNFVPIGSTPTYANAPLAAGAPVVLSTQITASWAANNNPPNTQYSAQISQDSGFTTFTPLTTSNLFVTFPSLTPNTTYFMRVMAVNLAGVATTPTNLLTARTLPGAPTPAPFSNVSTTQIQANWIAPANGSDNSYLAIISSAPNPSTNGLAGNRSASTPNTFALFTSGLSPNTFYFVDVQSINNSGNSSFVSIGSTPTWANAPLSAGAPIVLSTQITASWAANSNPPNTQYTAEISQDSGFTTFTPLTTSNLFVTFPSLTPNTTYFMRVMAVNQAGVATTPTNLLTARTLPGAPTPAPFSNVSTTQIQANWIAPANGSDNSYLAIISSAPNPSTNGLAGNRSASTPNTFALFTSGLSPNTFYFVDVQSINNSGNSSFVSIGSTPTWANAPLSAGAPVVLSTQITASWAANNNPPNTQYTAEISQDSGFTTFTPLTTSNLFVTFPSLTPNTTYFMRVMAVNLAGVATTPTNLLTARTLPGAPTPAPFSNVSTTQIQANWIAPANGSDNSYLAIISSAPNPSTNNLAGNKSSSTLNTFALFTSGLSPNTFYFVDVQSINNSGNSNFVPIGSTPTYANAPLAAGAPVVLSTQITASWAANNNPPNTQYSAQISQDSGFTTFASLTTSNLFITFPSLTPNTTYFMRVMAINQAGVATTPTSLATVITLANAPTAGNPSNVQVNQFTANWGKAGNPTGTQYHIQISPDPAFFNNVSSSFTLNNFATFATNILANTTYYMQVQAINYLNVSTVYTPLLPVVTSANLPDASDPTGILATQITANWTANSNPPGTLYLAQISTDTVGFTAPGSSTTMNLSATFMNLIPNTTYYMRVAAFVSGSPGGFTYLLPAVTLANSPVALAPTAILSNQIAVSWGANKNPVGTLFIAQLSPDSSFLTNVSSSFTFTSSATFSTNIIANTTYYIQVEAVNAQGLSNGFVPFITVTTLPNPPLPGSPSFSAVTTNQLQASWTRNGNPVGTTYKVVLSTAINAGTNNFSGNISSITANNSNVFSTLTPNTLYFVDVQVFNGANNSVFTPLGSTTTLANLPGAGSLSNVQANQITANWGANNNPPGTLYTAQIATDINFTLNVIPISTTSLSATFTSLSANTTYYLRVEAFNATTISLGFTQLGSTLTLASAPGQGALPDVQANQIIAHWTSGGNPPGTNYRALISTDFGFASSTPITTTSLFATFTGLSANTTYYLEVQALSGNNSSVFTSLGSTITLANLPGAISPSNVQANQITANWGANGNPPGTLYTAQIATDVNFTLNVIPISTTSLSATFAPLSANTTYYLRVEAFNSGNASTGFTSSASTVTLASTPGQGAPLDVQANQIIAHWTSGGNPPGTNYRALISTDFGFASSTPITTTSLFATFTGLSANTTYYLEVQALSGNNSSVFTSLGSTITLANLPGAISPSNVQANQITANWGANGNPPETLYTAQISTDFGFASSTSVSTGNLFATYSNLIPNTTYYLRVEAFNSGNASTGFTSTVSALTLANPPTPLPPSNVQINQITANWGANGNPVGTTYTVQISTNIGFSSFQSFNTTNLFWTFPGLSPTITYFMEVQARNAAGIPTLPFTLLPSTVTNENAAAAPGGAAFTNVSATALQANWTTSGNPSDTLYHVIISTSPSPSTNGIAANRNATTMNPFALFSGLFTNTIYYAEVNATTSGGASVYTNLTSVSTWADAPTPAAPTNIQAGQITANWSANGNPQGTFYNVQIATDLGFTLNVNTISTTSLSAVFTSLSANTLYYMQVRAQNQTNVPTSYISLPSTTTLPNDPGQVGFNGITTDQLQANWTPNGNPPGTLYQAILSTVASPSTNGLTGNQISTTTNTSAIFTGLFPNIRYYVDVAALNSIRNSAFTSLGNVATFANLPISSAPTNVQANQMTANWGANGNPPDTFYLAEASPDPTFNSNVTSVSTTSLSGTFMGLAGKTTYYMQVLAENQDQKSTFFIPLPSTTTLDNPAAAPGAAGLINPTTSQIQANWTANGNPIGTAYTAILSSAPSPSTNGLLNNQTFVGTSTTTLFTGLFPNTLYYVEVKATNTNGSSLYTSLGSLATLANQPAQANPSNIGSVQMTANWGANGNPPDTLYLVQIGLSTSSFIDTELTLETSFTFPGLSPNTLYYMQVRALNQAFETTPFTILPATSTILGAPGLPVLSFTQITDSSIIWTWNSVPNANSYYLIDQTGTQISPSFNSSTLQWQETGLAVNTSYSRSLVAFNVAGSSTSALVTAYTLAHQPLELSTQTVTSNSITVTWNANGNPVSTQYVAQITQGPGTARQLPPATGTEATFDNLVGATPYFITIQAINGTGTAASDDNGLNVTTLAQEFAAGNLTCVGAPSSALAFQVAQNEQVLVEIPAGAFNQCIQLGVKIVRAFPTAQSSGTPLTGTGIGSQLCDLKSNPSCNLVNDPLQSNFSITLTIPINDVSSAPQSQLVLARYDATHQMWVMLPSVVNTTENTITAQTDRTPFALYQVMVALPSADLSAIRVYPNPFRPSVAGHLGVNFTNMPVGANLQIFTITGEKVQSLIGSATGTAFWDGRNQSGQEAASGVYFVVVKSGGAKTILKVAVQR